jgi:hypothetical protein
MSKIYKTAKGQTIDLDQVKLANETAISVGNMRVNARGDKLGPDGKVVTGRNQIMDQIYAVDSQPAFEPGAVLDQPAFEPGSIASAQPEPAAVTQELITDPRAPKGTKGPQRMS